MAERESVERLAERLYYARGIGRCAELVKEWLTSCGFEYIEADNRIAANQEQAVPSETPCPMCKNAGGHPNKTDVTCPQCGRCSLDFPPYPTAHGLPTLAEGEKKNHAASPGGTEQQRTATATCDAAPIQPAPVVTDADRELANQCMGYMCGGHWQEDSCTVNIDRLASIIARHRAAEREELERLRKRDEFAEKYRPNIAASANASPDSHWGDIATILGARIRSYQQEKERRVYYQDIVYAVCNELDRIFGGKCACGTIEEPSTEVQELMKSLNRGNRVSQVERDLARVNREFDEYMKSLAEVVGCDMEEYALPSAHGNDRLRWASLIATRIVLSREHDALRAKLAAVEKERERIEQRAWERGEVLRSIWKFAEDCLRPPTPDEPAERSE